MFYSQFPNGEADPASLHGACPVLSGQKYAANLWVWNTPRSGYPGAPVKEKFRDGTQKEEATSSPSVSYTQVTARFRNTGKDPEMADAFLYYGEDRQWGPLTYPGPEIGVNTYEGHVWNVKVDGKTVKSWTISEKNGQEQNFEI